MRPQEPTCPSVASPAPEAAESRTAFRDALVRFEELARTCTADSLRMEDLVLRAGRAAPEATTHPFHAAGSAQDRHEVRRVTLLLLDILYGEPMSAVTRITTDLTGDRGRLRPAWEFALRVRGDAGGPPAEGVDHVHQVVVAYGRETFRPNLARCRALWSRLPAADRALLSPEVTGVMARVTEHLDALESAFSAVEHASRALRTTEHAGRLRAA
ncbi:hypothetical protein [Streptomyces sp. NPDC086023]|uniref:hypothetical protein n=1 Tax=Streptomyces sp. NPDC086023 TaxID=3365746 RepID=UPI0037D3552E